MPVLVQHLAGIVAVALDVIGEVVKPPAAYLRPPGAGKPGFQGQVQAVEQACRAYCSPSYDTCNWQVTGWYCHDPAVDACTVNADCYGEGWPLSWRHRKD